MARNQLQSQSRILNDCMFDLGDILAATLHNCIVSVYTEEQHFLSNFSGTENNDNYRQSFPALQTVKDVCCRGILIPVS